MLQSIREHATGWIAGVIFTIIVLSLGLLGVQSYVNVSNSNPEVAEVNGVSIPFNAYDVQYKRLRGYLDEHKTDYDIKHLKQTVLESLISREVLRQSVFSQGYRVSTDFVAENIRKIPMFQDNGVFSQQKFLSSMQANNLQPNVFMRKFADSIVINQFMNGVFFTSLDIPSEVNLIAKMFSQERSFSWVLLDKKYLEKVSWKPKFSNNEIKKYYLSHLNDFEIPEQVSLNYIYLAAQQKPKKNIAESQINLDSRCEKLANISYEQPDNLVSSAKELGDTVKTTRLFSRDNYGDDPITSSSAVRRIAFTPDILSAHNNSELIHLDSSSCVVVRLKEHLPARHKPLKSVKSVVIKKLKQKAAINKLMLLSSQLSADLNSGKANIIDLAKNYHGLVMKNSGWVKRDETKLDRSLLEVAFKIPDHSKNKQSFSYGKTANGYVVVGLNAVKYPALKPESEKYKRLADQYNLSMGELEFSSAKQALQNDAKIKVKLDLSRD